VRGGGREWDEIREIRMTREFLKHPEGSVLIEMGSTKVICTATLEDKAPPFLKNTGRGWLTSEYAMLPGSTKGRTGRESSLGRVGGSTHEIQRLIGRSLRAVTELNSFGERTIYIDCDVIQADGGTRTAAITGGFIALALALKHLKKQKMIQNIPLQDYVAAVSVGIVDGTLMLDLNYEEDSRADVDMNVVMLGRGDFVEVQGTAEREPFSKAQVNQMLTLAKQGIQDLIRIQKRQLGALLP